LNGTNITDALSILSNFPDYFVISAGEMDINPLRHTFKSGSRGIEVLFPENNHLRSQDLPSIYFDVGMFYLAYPKTWIQPEKFWYQNNAKFVKIPRENCIDVDSYRDLEKLISRINIIGSGDAKS
jgi:CMP-N-acetylneuraminic acid synthetase